MLPPRSDRIKHPAASSRVLTTPSRPAGFQPASRLKEAVSKLLLNSAMLVFIGALQD